MAEIVFEVMIHADLQTRMGGKGRWYIAGSFGEHGPADKEYRMLCDEYPASIAVVALVRSEVVATSGIFRDRIIEARGKVPLIERAQARPFTPELRQTLKVQASPARLTGPRAQPPARTARPAAAPWPWIAAAAVAMGVFAAIRGTGL